MAMATVLPVSSPRSDSTSGSHRPLMCCKAAVGGKLANVKALGDGILDHMPQSGGLLPESVQHRLSRSFSYNLVTGSTHKQSGVVKSSLPGLIASSPERAIARVAPRLPTDSQTDRASLAGLPLGTGVTPKRIQGRGLIVHSAIAAPVPSPNFPDSKIFTKKQADLNGSNQIVDVNRKTQIGDVKRKTRFDTSRMLSSAKSIAKNARNLQEPKGVMAVCKIDPKKESPATGLERQAEMRGTAPVFTILQRPNDQEAAKELFARFFKKTESSSEEDSDNEKVDMGASDCNIDIFPIELEGTATLASGSNSQKAPSSGARNPHALKRSSSKRHNSEPLMGTNTDNLGTNQWFSSAEIERWAGPAYCNSPHPSSLPLPSFSLKQSRTSSLELSGFAAEQPSTFFHERSYTSISPSHSNMSSPSSLVSESPPIYIWDTVSATKDLRKLLNLDVCSI